MFVLMKVFLLHHPVVKCMILGFSSSGNGALGRSTSSSEEDIHHVLDIHKFRSIQKYLFSALKAKTALICL